MPLGVYGTKPRPLLKPFRAVSCNFKSGTNQATVPRKHGDWENIVLLHHSTSDTTSSDLQFSEQKVSAYYSIMVVYLYVGEHHPVVNGRKHF